MHREYFATPLGTRVAHRGPDGIVEFVEYLKKEPLLKRDGIRRIHVIAIVVFFLAIIAIGC
jgi:hypothetical protein